MIVRLPPSSVASYQVCTYMLPCICAAKGRESMRLKERREEAGGKGGGAGGEREKERAREYTACVCKHTHVRVHLHTHTQRIGIYPQRSWP